MSAARLIDVHEMAVIIGMEPSYLRRRSSRARLESKGCPPPVMTAPLKWSGPLVERWINGDTVVVVGAEPPDEKALWRARLTEQYGSAE